MTLTIPNFSLKGFGTYIVAGVLTAAITFGVAWVVLPTPAPTPVIPNGATPREGALGFGLVPDPNAPPKSLPAAPQNIVITLVSFHKDQPPAPGTRADWWTSTGTPRVPQITQFDGGPLQGVNCTMAAGAMLARLGYGIVTTGTQLRSLQSDQDGGTSLANLNDALQAGWGVHFARGWITATELRGLLWAGAGAVIQVIYGDVPVGLRNQRDFTGAHSMYVDAFRPNGPDGPAAYYVMDPIGRPDRGYNGSWWPADVVEAAADDFGGGRIITSWAFAGGVAPSGPYASLPPDAYPSSSPGATASPPVLASLPPPDLPTPDFPSGDLVAIPPDLVNLFTGGAFSGGSTLIPSFSICVSNPAPAFCPIGIPALYPVGASAPPTAPPITLPITLDLKYADSVQPGMERTIFTAPSGVVPTFTFWPSSGTGAVGTATVQEALMDGKDVWIATFPVQSGGYHFVASGVGAGGAGVSQIGTVTIGP
jgi:hypothetical protein